MVIGYLNLVAVNRIGDAHTAQRGPVFVMQA